jgi:hypothetical protein
MEAEFIYLKGKKKKKKLFSSYRLPKQQKTTLGLQGILRVKTFSLVHAKGAYAPGICYTSVLRQKTEK